MAFDKRYPNRKDWRRPYRQRAKASCRSCRANGGCPWCLGNHMHARRKAEEKAKAELRDTTPA